MAYQHLLSNGKIGTLNLRNRIILSAMGSNFCETDGTCTERVQNYYESIAKGGTGLIILETSAAAWPNGGTTANTIGFSNDSFLPGLSALVKKVHAQGAAIAAQLNHGGKSATEDVVHGRPVFTPSLPKRLNGDLMSSLTRSELATFIKAAGPDGKGARYHVMTKADIKELTGSFADAAERAQRAGFDAIEIHAGHGYILSSFLSPFANVREDEYGGSAENRSRFLCEIITAIREKLGQDFPIIVRLDSHEYGIEGGTTITDSIAHAQHAEAAGANAIDVSGYGNGLNPLAFTSAPLVHEKSGLLKFARQIKANVSIPIIAVGRITPEVAEQEIKQGNIDFLTMGRKLLADPELPNKLATDPKSVRPCIYCYVCVSKIFLNKPMACAVNPEIGREKELGTFTPAATAKNITIVGGGPAGLEAARVLAIRGHKVNLYEQSNKLGGTARIAALPYAPNGDLLNWLIHSVKQLPINIHMNTIVNIKSLIAEKPEHVILAVGATRKAPEIEGKNLRHVFDGDQLRGILFGDSKTATAALSFIDRAIIAVGRLFGINSNINALRSLSKFYMPLGKRVVLIGGGLVGLELAEYLVERGRKVTVLEPSANFGQDLSVVRRARVLHMLRHDGVELIKHAQVEKITHNAVQYQLKDEHHSVETDTVIIALGATNNTSLADELSQHDIEFSSIGDGHEGAYLEGAILGGRTIGVSL